MKTNTHLSPSILIELMENQRYGVEYQPIVCVKSQEIYAYECLSRFFTKDNSPIRPDLVYSSLHDSPLSLFQVEYQQKKLQLAHAPHKVDIFVNLDQDSYFSTGTLKCDNPFLKLFKDFQKSKITVELIENSEINDAIMSLAMIDNLSKNNIDTAIDDLCNPQSMVSMAVIQLVEYIKLDRYVVTNRSNHNFMLLVESMINYARSAGKKVILEGVETAEDLRFAKQLNVDFVQGFFYREQFKHVT
ncbi:EAL domain-containing protein [Colwellia sp. C1TZA3]|uniref:EAL domain-containing protein n=1 Tax=Colwellia sp. C1TZA3 TaxID=2508879 RepID=UPI0011BA24D7|nr:EAL domain-containing protein [Colwellia sp. C1TZA3]TWX72479.1 EAL domain-containing protein [Colwellia sp. C1TZA3]